MKIKFEIEIEVVSTEDDLKPDSKDFRDEVKDFIPYLDNKILDALDGSCQGAASVKVIWSKAYIQRVKK